MHLLNKALYLWGALLIISAGILSGQSAYELTFQGYLSDIEGAGIAEERFNLNVQLQPVQSRTILYEYNADTITDRDGWFGFTLSNISEYMMSEDGSWKPVELKLEFKPGEQTTWLEEGNEFMVVYTLAPSGSPGILFQMTRMEGTALEVHSEDHLHAFRDLYPFAYLTGGFLITDQPPIDSISVDDLRIWLTPELEDGEDPSSRGVKGGFPVGGYRKKR